MGQSSAPDEQCSSFCPLPKSFIAVTAQGLRSLQFLLSHVQLDPVLSSGAPQDFQVSFHYFPVWEQTGSSLALCWAAQQGELAR